LQSTTEITFVLAVRVFVQYSRVTPIIVGLNEITFNI